MDSSGKSSPVVNGWLGFWLNIGFLIALLVYFALFAHMFRSHGQPLYVLIVATAALNVGAVLGFLYSTFGEEDERFSKVFVAVNGVLSGATLTDLLQKDHSMIFKCLEHLTVSCGLEEKYAGIVFMVIVTCVPIGFFGLYFNRKLFLNPQINLASKMIQNANEVLNQKPLEIVTDPDMEKPTADPEVKAAAKVITENKDAIKSDSAGVLANLGRSFYELGQYAEAIAPLEKALKIRPNQPETLLAVASAMVNSGKQLDAIGILEKLTSLSSGPTRAWKLLGYSYLYYPDDKPDKREKLEESIEASSKYIAFQPDDYGAKLNLACAYGQLGPEYADAKTEVIALTKELLANVPGVKQRIKDLTLPGQDFAQWTGVKEFMDLIN